MSDQAAPPGMQNALMGMLVDPRANPMQRAAALAQAQGAGAGPVGGGMQNAPPTGAGIGSTPPQMPPAAPPAAPPGVDAIRTGAAMAAMQGAAMAAPERAEMRLAQGGAVRGYADGGEVDDEPATGGLSSWDPRLVAAIKGLMTGDSGPTGEDKGLALAQAGFGMAASQSPRFLQAAGEGGLHGLQALMAARKMRAEEGMKASALAAQIEARQAAMQQSQQLSADRLLAQREAIQQRAEAAGALNESRQDAIAQRRDAAADRKQAASDLAGYRQDMLDLKKGAVGANLPEGTGDAFIEQLPEADQAMVRKISSGDINPQTLSARDGYRNRIIAATAQFDPTYDQSNVGARFALRKDFTSGKSAQNITSANTLIGHLSSLKTAADKLGNSDYPAWNKIANFATTQTGDPRVKDFNTKRQAVADELTRLFRGTGGTITEIQEWQHNIDNAGSPEQLQTVIDSAVELMQSRINSLADQYNRGFGTQKSGNDFLSPKSLDVITKISHAPNATAPASAAAPAAPAADVIIEYIRDPKTGRMVPKS